MTRAEKKKKTQKEILERHGELSPEIQTALEKEFDANCKSARDYPHKFSFVSNAVLREIISTRMDGLTGYDILMIAYHPTVEKILRRVLRRYNAKLMPSGAIAIKEKAECR